MSAPVAQRIERSPPEREVACSSHAGRASDRQGHRRERQSPRPPAQRRGALPMLLAAAGASRPCKHAPVAGPGRTPARWDRAGQPPRLRRQPVPLPSQPTPTGRNVSFDSNRSPLAGLVQAKARQKRPPLGSRSSSLLGIAHPLARAPVEKTGTGPLAALSDGPGALGGREAPPVFPVPAFCRSDYHRPRCRRVFPCVAFAPRFFGQESNEHAVPLPTGRHALPPLR